MEYSFVNNVSVTLTSYPCTRLTTHYPLPTTILDVPMPIREQTQPQCSGKTKQERRDADPYQGYQNEGPGCGELEDEVEDGKNDKAGEYADRVA